MNPSNKDNLGGKYILGIDWRLIIAGVAVGWCFRLEESGCCAAEDGVSYSTRQLPNTDLTRRSAVVGIEA